MYFDPLKAERNERGATTRVDGKHSPFNRGPEERVLPENHTGVLQKESLPAPTLQLRGQ